ncbi:MAG: NAAT family transporter [Bacteriovoracaceae bacterium]|nr:NAAT family transporter [Bacteriovoracaceae bacterium]
MQTFSEISQFAIALFSIINPIGTIPIFLSLTKNFSDEEITRVARSCAIAIFMTIFISLFLGKDILNFFGISVASFRIGGGILLSTMAFSMLKAQNAESKLNNAEIDAHSNIDEIGIVPLAIPLLAGPGAISTSIIYSERVKDASHWPFIVLALLVIVVIIFFILSWGRRISQRMGRVGVNVMTRIMGLVLMALSVEFIASGVKQIFPSLN